MQDEAANFYQSLDSSHLRDLPFIPKPLGIILSNISYVIAMTIQALFYILVSTAALLFKHLRKKLKTVGSENSEQTSLRLDEWRKQYDLVCQLVDKINSCFGLILIITVCHCFVTSAKFSTQIFNGERKQWKNYFFILVQLYVRLLVIIVGSHYMHRQVY